VGWRFHRLQGKRRLRLLVACSCIVAFAVNVMDSLRSCFKLLRQVLAVMIVCFACLQVCKLREVPAVMTVCVACLQVCQLRQVPAP